MKFSDVMIDLETLGTVGDSVILSIGAVSFDPSSDKIDDTAGFYQSVSIESNLDRGRRIQEDTLIWWMQQSAAAQKVFSEPKVTLDQALVNLSAWFDNPSACVWSNGAALDIPMMEHAYRQLGTPAPWKFRNSRCYRTIAALPQVVAAGIKKPTARHHALLDAVDQAKTLQQMWRVLTTKKGTK